jgi:hypothetical protein
MPRELSGAFKLGLQVGGIHLGLCDAIDSEGWRKACATGLFVRQGIVGRFLLGAGLSSGDIYSAINQELLLFSGKVFVAPDLGDGPLKFGTSAAAFFRDGRLHRLRVRVAGNKKAASHFAKQCTHALDRLLGKPDQHTKGGAPVWWGNTDRLILVHKADACLIHELAGRQ